MTGADLDLMVTAFALEIATMLTVLPFRVPLDGLNDALYDGYR